VIAAVEWAATNRATYDIRVINLSLGHPVFEPAADDPLVQAVEAAVRAGIVVVASAGNCGYNSETGQSGYAGISSPGNAPSAITVGALDTKGTETRDDTVASIPRSPGQTFRCPTSWRPGTTSWPITCGRRCRRCCPRGKTTAGGRLTFRFSTAAGVVSGAVALMMARRQAWPTAPGSVLHYQGSYSSCSRASIAHAGLDG
jgi:serine protease AprX